MSRWLVEKTACETWMIESSNSSLRSVTVTSLISTPESIQICFMPVIFIVSYSCSPAAVQLLSGSSLSLLSLYPSFEQSTAQNLSWERDRAPAWAVSRTHCWAVLRAWPWSVCPRELPWTVTSLNPDGKRDWRQSNLTDAPMICSAGCSLGVFSGFQEVTVTIIMVLFPQSLSSQDQRATALAGCRCHAAFSWPHLARSQFSVPNPVSFLDPPSFLFSYKQETSLSPLLVDLLGLLLSVGSPGPSKGNRLLQTSIRKRDIFYLLTK